MANVSWKGSILDTYEKNSGFGGRTGDDVKGVDKAAGVDYISNKKFGGEAVEGFKTNKNALDHTQTDFNMVNTATKTVNSAFEALDTNSGYKWDATDGISPYNPKNKYSNNTKK